MASNAAYYFDTIGDVFHFGRHRQQLLCDVMADDPTYITWCINTIGEFTISEKAFEQARMLFPNSDFADILSRSVGELRYDDEDEYESREDDYGEDCCEETSYGRYAGSYAQDEMGYSDDDIDIIFDGDPDAYWNID